MGLLIGIYKESVELSFVYLIEGCGKTLSEINDTIPHTRIDMGYWYAECDLPQVSIRKWVLFSVVLPIKKTTTFPIKDLRKTLSQYVMSDRKLLNHTPNVKNLSQTGNTHRGIVWIFRWCLLSTNIIGDRESYNLANFLLITLYHIQWMIPIPFYTQNSFCNNRRSFSYWQVLILN